MSSSSNQSRNKNIDEYRTASGKLVRKINIAIPKRMPKSIVDIIEKRARDTVDEWRKAYRESRFRYEMLQHRQQRPKKEKGARRSPSKERDAVRSPKKEKAAADAKEKAPADAKQWIKQFLKRQNELMLQSPPKKKRGS